MGSRYYDNRGVRIWMIIVINTKVFVLYICCLRYGDRAPRFFIGRVFCIIWILIGMSIIAIFTAMVTASLYASIQYQLIIHGSVVSLLTGLRSCLTKDKMKFRAFRWVLLVLAKRK